MSEVKSELTLQTSCLAIIGADILLSCGSVFVGILHV